MPGFRFRVIPVSQSGLSLPSLARAGAGSACRAGGAAGRSWTARVGRVALSAAASAALSAAIAVTAWSAAGGVQARTTPEDLPPVALSALPGEAQQTKQLILAGGPFPYSKDGTVFFNRERLLPSQPRGYYREYTVTTPGARNRGARRIVCGGEVPTAPRACYYTADHYASFSRIVADR